MTDTTRNEDSLKATSSSSSASDGEGDLVLQAERMRMANQMETAKDGEAYVMKIGSEITAADNATTDSNKLNDHFESQPSANESRVADPLCDPKKPVKLQFQDISAAAFKIRGGVRKTALSKCWTLSDRYDMEVYTKNEFTQVTGSFKERGARYTLMQLTKQQKKVGVTAASAGNHALALSYHGKLLKIPLPDVDVVVCPVGGGGLIAGIALAIKYINRDVQIIGVEAESCPSFTRAMENGSPTYTKPESTLADGLSVPVVGVNAFATAKDLVDEMVTVNESDIARAILQLVEVEKAVVEGAGAVGLAALLAGKLSHLKGKKVVFPLCGGNIDTTVLGRSLERGLAAEGRLIRFSVTVSDRPGGIAELTALLAKAGASIKDIFHERAWLKSDIFSVRVKVVLETRDWDHVKDLEVLLQANYNDVWAYSDVGN